MLKKLICMGMVAVMLHSAFCLAACNDKNKNESARNRIKEITGIEVPNESEILFHYIDNDFVNGRKEQYTVFKFIDEPIVWLEKNKFLRSDDETLTEDESETLVAQNERYFWNTDMGFDTIKMKKILKEYIPNLENAYHWIRTKRVHFFYYPDKLMLMVFVKPS